MSDERVPVELNGRELDFLRSALLEWSGPASPTDALALAMGFTSADSLPDETWALWERIEAGDALAADDWRRVLLAAEIVFVSDVVGSGLDWEVTTDFSDKEAIAILRGLQGKLPRWRDSVQFTLNETGDAEINDPERPAP